MLPTIDIHTHHPRPGQLSLPNVRIQDEHPDFPASGPYSAGIHPWDTAEAHEAWLELQAHRHYLPGLPSAQGAAQGTKERRSGKAAKGNTAKGQACKGCPAKPGSA